ncbi:MULTISPECIES: hypothetical protein [Haloferax]|uniref:DUF8159 domain-containing protein n=3 Tax=Haloferax gibbonsii TaxID=35746 RepID=A0A871BIK6_HALGI|nr:MULTISPECIES: hypothetical protein [Haloferax]QOS12639.1 uncharacterized protein HfgLR_12515 [Haloferax gibbonsii]
MRRRRFLTAFSAMVVGTAGCAQESETEASTQSTTTLPTKTPSPFVEQADEFRSFLQQEEISIVELLPQPPANAVELTYVSNEDQYEEVGGEIGTIAGGFFNRVANGWEAERLNAIVMDSPESRFGTWHAKSSWFADYQDGEISANELSLKVLDTLSRAEDA